MKPTQAQTTTRATTLQPGSKRAHRRPHGRPHWQALLGALLLCCTASGPAVAAKAGGDEVRAEDSSRSAALQQAATEQRLILRIEQGQPAGPGWNWLLQQAREAQFLAIAEEHGIAENPALVTALFEALQPAGYRHLVIEISPPVASILDRVLQADGLDGLARLYAQPGSEPAFFGMREEAQMLAAVRRLSDADRALWGVDYEVGADRLLLRELAALDPPEAAQAALATLAEASRDAWQRYDDSGGPQHIFSFSGDPALVAAVRGAWSSPPRAADEILHTLEETLTINRFWVDGAAWASNQRRAELLRQNFLRHWRAARADGPAPRLLLKLGASHLVRGRNMTDTFDIGALLPELAALEGRSSVHVLLLAGRDSEVARFDPSRWRYQPAPAGGGLGAELEPLLAAADAEHPTLIDLRPLRPLVGMRPVAEGLKRVVLGFDAVLVMSGSTASGNFLPEQTPRP